MMQVYTSKGVAYITIGDSLYNFPEDKGFLDNDALISSLSLKEIGDLLKMFGGLPFNFMDYLVKKVKLYGDSLEVSSFICDGEKVWLNKQQRSSIMNLLNLMNEDSFELILHDKVHIVSTEKLKQLLNNLEIFSYKCLVNTTKHVENIKKLKKYQEIVNYNYTTGFPEKLILE